MKPSFLAGPALTLALALLVPVFFVFSQNWFMVEPEAMLWSAGIAFFAACILFLTASLVGRCWRKVSPNVPRRLHRLAFLVFCLILVEMLCFFLQEPLRAAIPGPRWLRTAAFHILPCIGLFFAAHRLGFFHINVFLLIFFVFSAANLGVSLWKEDPPSVPAPSSAAQEIGSRPSTTYEMKERPNIYLFFLESFHSLDVQRKIYGIDTSEFETYLTNAGFTDYGKVYANSPITLLSLADTFSFYSGRAFARGNSDAAAGIRRMLAGSEANTLLRTLKANKYTTVFLVGYSTYYGTIKGKFLDSSDSLYALPPDGAGAKIHGVFSCFRMLNSRFRQQPMIDLRNRLTGLSTNYDTIYTGSWENKISQAITAHMRPEAPLFIAIKGEAGRHTPPNGSYTWRQRADWVQSGTYQGAVKKGSQELQRICDNIIARDPGAMIILIGDHGAWRLRDVEKEAASLDALKVRLQEIDTSFQDFCDDRYAVFLGVRLPYGQRADISYGLPMSHVNLFRHVFAYLNNDQSILAARKPSESYWRDYVIVKEGKPAVE